MQRLLKLRRQTKQFQVISSNFVIIFMQTLVAVAISAAAPIQTFGQEKEFKTYTKEYSKVRKKDTITYHIVNSPCPKCDKKTRIYNDLVKNFNDLRDLHSDVIDDLIEAGNIEDKEKRKANKKKYQQESSKVVSRINKKLTEVDRASIDLEKCATTCPTTNSTTSTTDSTETTKPANWKTLLLNGTTVEFKYKTKPEGGTGSLTFKSKGKKVAVKRTDYYWGCGGKGNFKFKENETVLKGSFSGSCGRYSATFKLVDEEKGLWKVDGIWTGSSGKHTVNGVEKKD